jgi:hypothetical protein
VQVPVQPRVDDQPAADEDERPDADAGPLQGGAAGHVTERGDRAAGDEQDQQDPPPADVPGPDGVARR